MFNTSMEKKMIPSIKNSLIRVRAVRTLGRTLSKKKFWKASISDFSSYFFFSGIQNSAHAR